MTATAGRIRRLSQRHRLTLALWQLAILLPILVVAGAVVIWKRGSIYFPLYLAVERQRLTTRAGPDVGGGGTGLFGNEPCGSQ